MPPGPPRQHGRKSARMNLHRDATSGRLVDGQGRIFDARRRVWQAGEGRQAAAVATLVAPIEAVRWLEKDSGLPCPVPVGVVGPREARPEQRATAAALGRGSPTRPRHPLRRTPGRDGGGVRGRRGRTDGRPPALRRCRHGQPARDDRARDRDRHRSQRHHRACRVRPGLAGAPDLAGVRQCESVDAALEQIAAAFFASA